MNKVFRFLYGTMTYHEKIKFLFLAVVFLIASTVSWMLHMVRQVCVLMLQFAPETSNWLSSIVTLITILLVGGFIIGASKIIDKTSHYRFVSVVSFIYMLLLGLFAESLRFFDVDFFKTAHLPLASIGLVIIESFDVIIPGLLWAFFTITLSSEMGRKGLSFVVAAHVMGSIIGPWVGYWCLQYGFDILLAASACFILFIPIILTTLGNTLCVNRPECKLLENEVHEKKSLGMLGGLRVLWHVPYVMGITLAMVATRLIDAMRHGALEELNYVASDPSAWGPQLFGVDLLAWWGTIILWGSFFGALLLLSLLVRQIKISFLLLIYPITVVFLVGMMVFIAPENWQGFWLVLCGCNIIFAVVHQPVLELLYFGASPAARFKAGLWIHFIDSFFISGFLSSIFTQGYVDLSRLFDQIWVTCMCIGIIWFLYRMGRSVQQVF